MPSLLPLLALLSLSLSPQKVYDFSEEDDSRWLTVHDSVMGGISNGSIGRTESNTLLFQGNLSLEYNGGFASFRSADRSLELPDSDGIEIKVLGDGRSYICSFERDGARTFGGGYWQEFETRDGAWTVVRLPWDKFEPYSFGNKMGNMPALTPESARSIGIYLYDKKAGPYRVEFDSFSTYVDEPAPAALTVSASTPAKDVPAGLGRADRAPRERGLDSYLDKVVNIGVGEFNGGDPAACAERYRQALEAVLALTQVDGNDATAIEIALVRAEGQDSRRAAWTLRRAIDDLRQG
ncbi:MAG: CIA30 family protein [Planctomycetota bacterium]|jgi:monofunctional biosynthetic peptidoglycan transglycosylase